MPPLRFAPHAGKLHISQRDADSKFFWTTLVVSRSLLPNLLSLARTLAADSNQISIYINPAATQFW